MVPIYIQWTVLDESRVQEARRMRALPKAETGYLRGVIVLLNMRGLTPLVFMAKGVAFLATVISMTLLWREIGSLDAWRRASGVTKGKA